LPRSKSRVQIPFPAPFFFETFEKCSMRSLLGGIAKW
jgi:hypothetical protein